MKQSYFSFNCVLRSCGLLLAGLSCTMPFANAQTFAAPVTYAATTSATNDTEDVALGDVNGDGRLDLVVTNPANDAVGVLIQQVNGGFAPVVSYSFGKNVLLLDVALGDVNGDGRLDIVAAMGQVGVLLGQAGGTFASAVTYGSATGSAHGVALGDVNGDGRLDIVTANSNSSSVGVLLGQASGGFAAATTFPVGAGVHPIRVALGDLNRDGLLDIVTVNGDTDNTYVSKLAVLLGQTNGNFAAVTTYTIGSSFDTERVVLGDVDADGQLDAVTANLSANSVSVLRGQVGGTFNASTTYASGTPYPAATAPFNVADVKLSDVNGDGRLDIMTTIGLSISTTGVGVLLGQVTGFQAASTFLASGSSYTGRQPQGLAVGDVTGDGRPDAVVMLYVANQVSVLRNMSTYLATTAGQLPMTEFEVYPNPAHSECVIHCSQQPVQISLYNSLGQLVRQQAVVNAAADYRLGLAGLAPGLYSLQVQIAGQKLTKFLAIE